MAIWIVGIIVFGAVVITNIICETLKDIAEAKTENNPLNKLFGGNKEEKYDTK